MNGKIAIFAVFINFYFVNISFSSNIPIHGTWIGSIQSYHFSANGEFSMVIIASGQFLNGMAYYTGNFTVINDHQILFTNALESWFPSNKNEVSYINKEIDDHIREYRYDANEDKIYIGIKDLAMLPFTRKVE